MCRRPWSAWSTPTTSSDASRVGGTVHPKERRRAPCCRRFTNRGKSDPSHVDGSNVPPHDAPMEGCKGTVDRWIVDMRKLGCMREPCDQQGWQRTRWEARQHLGRKMWMIGPWRFLRRSNEDGCAWALQRSRATSASERMVLQMPEQKKTTFPGVQAQKIIKGDSRPPGVTPNRQADIPHRTRE